VNGPKPPGGKTTGSSFSCSAASGGAVASVTRLAVGPAAAGPADAVVPPDAVVPADAVVPPPVDETPPEPVPEEVRVADAAAGPLAVVVAVVPG